MKVQLLLSATIVVSVALLGFMKIRKKEKEREDKRNRFEDIKLRVTYDVLREYQSEKAETQNRLVKIQTQHKALEEKVNMLKTKADKTKGDVDICNGGQKTATDQLASAETEFNNLKAESDKEKASWRTELETLKQQLAARSSVCNFLKKGSPMASKLCGDGVIVEAPKREEPKAEAPKQEAPKAEAPEQEAPKAEAPKAEAPKQEAPKAEAPKAEAPKAEAPKAEAPKQEAPKAEAPKQEAPKAKVPKKG